MNNFFEPSLAPSGDAPSSDCFTSADFTLGGTGIAPGAFGRFIGGASLAEKRVRL